MTTPTLDLLLPQVQAALARHETAAAVALAAPLRPSIERDAEIASLWLLLLRAAPGTEGLVADVRRIVARWPDDRQLRLAGCDALIRAAELRGSDVPPGDDDPAHLAAELAAAALSALDAAERGDAAVGGYWSMNCANALRLAHRHDEALAHYDAALALDADNGDWWFNAGLLHKARGDFERGLQCAQRAAALNGERRGVLWNVALCATALGRGEQAAEAMRKLGFAAHVLPSGMPHVDGLPPVQLRVATKGSGHGFAGLALDQGIAFEVVWVSPASPCHGVVQTPTFREACVDYGDLVLWDGTPVGFVEHDGKKVPRFPLLSVLRKGDEHRLRFVALEHDAGQVAAFAADVPEPSQLFAQRAHVEMLCARCASGEHMHKHKHTPLEPHRLVYGKLVVPASVDLPQLRAALDAALGRHPNVQLVVPGLLEALGDTRAAGKAHQLWRGLERSAAKSGRALAAPGT